MYKALFLFYESLCINVIYLLYKCISCTLEMCTIFYFQYFMQLLISTGHDWSFKLEWLEGHVDTNSTTYSGLSINSTTKSENISTVN